MSTETPTILPGSASGIARAANALTAGDVVAFGTEPVYGLGADAGNAAAVARVFALKGRPPQNPLICHVDGPAMAKTIARVDDRAAMVMAQYWPGPLTLILPYAGGAAVADIARAGLDTVAVRAPAHPTARSLISAFGKPMVGPSANKSGRLSPTTAMMVAEAFGIEVPLILSSGKCEIGLESTVLDLSKPDRATIMRPGALGVDDLIDLLPEVMAVNITDNTAPISPGLLLRHYAPRIPVRINVRDNELSDGEAFIGFGPNPFTPKGQGERRNLSPVGDLDEAAHNLFAMLHELEDSGATAIAIAPIPDMGLGLAINDRLRRAAAASKVDA